MLIILGLVSWYYYTKLQNSEQNYRILHNQFQKIYIENKRMETRLQDLQCYKNDVSKTFGILNNELLLINNGLRRRSIRYQPPNHFQMHNIDDSNVSLLTPELLNTLFVNINQESSGIEVVNETNNVETNNIETNNIETNNIETNNVETNNVENEIGVENDFGVENEIGVENDFGVENEIDFSENKGVIENDLDLEYLNELNNNSLGNGYNQFLIEQNM